MKRNLHTILAAAALVVFFMPSCKVSCKKGSGNKTTETRKVENFTKIDAGGGYKVILKQDSSQNVAVTVDDNLQQEIDVYVSGNTLTIKSKHSLCTDGNTEVVIGVRNLEAFHAAGAIELENQDTLRVKDLDLDLAGAGKIKLNLNAANLRTSCRGASEITLKGQAASHLVKVSGTGKLDALDFVVGNYTIETSGASDNKINVLNSLIVKTTGAATVKYKGNPTDVVNKERGSSTLEQIK